jgi:hypothetical protein
MGAGEIVREVREGTVERLGELSGRATNGKL